MGKDKGYFVADHLGSTNGLTNASGSLTASNVYDSFGNPSNMAFPTRYQYTGRERDDMTGLQYNRARWYDPNLGRFISEDPIGFAGGRNWFNYVDDNSVNLFDPNGLVPNPRYAERCNRWAEIIANITLDIATRIGEMAENGVNKAPLPWRAPNDTLKPSLSRWGHQRIVNELKASKARYEALIKTYCDDDDDKNAPEKEPCKDKASDLSQPTPEEIRLQIESANEMEAFWTAIAAGDLIAGAGYFLPELVPAALPYVPQLAGQTPQFAR